MGRKVLELKGYSPEEIRSLFDKDEKYKIGIKLYAVYQVSLGQASRKLEDLYNTSFKQILNWVHRFEKEGLEGLKDKTKSGRNPRLSKKQKEEIKSLLQTNKPDEFGYNTSTWNGPILKDYIEKNYKISFKKAQIYNILSSLGFTYQKGRAKYPEADEQKQKEFKKEYKKNSKKKRQIQYFYLKMNLV